MRKKNFKGRCEKRSLSKCHDVCRTYDPIQYAYADVLQADDDITEIRCNVLLDGLELGEFTTDFVCVKTNGDLMVRECVSRNHLNIIKQCMDCVQADTLMPSEQSYKNMGKGKEEK